MTRLTAAIAIVVAAACIGVASPSRAEMADGIAAYRNGDYAAAFREFEALAQSGDVAAQYNVAQMYRQGQGVAQNYPLAIHWYEKAAERGLSSAQHNLALMHQQGKGVSVDYPTAVRWWHRAARQDHVVAQFNLGVAYANGFGVEADPLEALFWYSVAMVNGYVGARPIRESLATTMNLDQLLAVTERVKNWRPVREIADQ